MRTESPPLSLHRCSMLVDVTDLEYLTVRRSKSHKDSRVIGLGAPVARALASRVLSLVSGSEAKVLMYLLGVTICRGQRAREVSIRELEHGIKDEDGGALDHGTGLAKNTLRTSLKSLCESGTINIYRKPEQDGAEIVARIYEIDFTRLLSVAEITTVLGENAMSEGSKTVVPPTKNCPPLHTSMKSKRDTSISILPASCLVRKSNAEQVGSMAFIGKQKKPVPVAPVYGSATEALQAVQGRARAVQATRVANAATIAPSSISRVDMQAVFDRHSTALSLGYRLMVTQREHGFLRKRLAENPPQDFSDFVRWSLTYWGTLSSQNRTATRKDLQVKVVRKSLPPAPHFNTFCYWYPYFLKSYQNFLTGRENVKDGELEDETEKDRVIKSLTRRVVEAERNTSVLRRRMGSARDEQPATPAAPKPRPRTRVDADLLAPVEFQDWDANNRTGRK